MATKKDPRRPDLAIPYRESQKKPDDGDIAGAMSSTLPMAAMFTRNKMIGWTAVVFALQNWLSESSSRKNTNKTPAYFSVGMAVLSLVVMGRTATGAPAPAPAPPGAAS